MSDPSAFLSVFPCWAVVSQMGHREIAGRASITTELGTPLIVVEVPAVPADERHEELPARVELIAPASLYSVRICSEAEVLRHRLGVRPRVFRPSSRLLEDRLAVAAEVADEHRIARTAAPVDGRDEAAHPDDCDCDDCRPF